MSKHGGRLVVDGLRSERVRRVFTVPGESFLPVLDALCDASDKIDLVSARHEENAGFAAEGYAKASGEVGVAMVTRGVGSTNLSIALHTARQDSTPLVALVGQIPTGNRYREAFQEVDLARFFSPLVKWAIEIPSTDRIPELLQRAFHVARSERPGPVVVGLPEDVLYGEADPPPRTRIRTHAPAPSEDAIRAAYARLTSASYPVVLAGREVLTTGASDPLRELAEALDLPVMTAFRRFDAFPNDHDHYVGNIALGTPKKAVEPLAEADVLLALGTRFTEITTHSYAFPRDDTHVVHVAGSQEVAGVWGATTEPVVADVRAFVEALLAHHRAQSEGADAAGRGSANVRRYRETYERIRAFDPPDADAEGPRISDVMRALDERTPPETAIVTDAGNFSAWVSRYYPFRKPLTHFGPISGAMGYALPAAIGISLADPDRHVVALAGDGGFPMTMSELSFLQERRPNVLAVVFVNGLYGTILMHQRKQFSDRPVGTTLHNPSFAAIAEAYDLPAHRVREPGDFEAALERAVAAGGPAVLEVTLTDERLAAWSNFRP